VVVQPDDGQVSGPDSGRVTGPDGDRGLPDLVPARMVNEYAYCPRLCYLEWVQGEFRDSADTVEGRFQHRRVDQSEGYLPPEEDMVLSDDDGPAKVRSVTISGSEVGAIARIDLVEAGLGEAVPVDYKRGEIPEAPFEPWEPERVQLCVQGLLLRENGYKCEHGIIYFAASRRRVRVPFTEALVNRTVGLIMEMKQCLAEGRLPPPLEDSPKCPRCSLVGICLPDETNLLRGTSAETAEVRRLIPIRDDAGSIYVHTQGVTVGKHGDALQFRQKGAVIDEVRLMDVAQLSLYGNIQVTAQAVREMCSRGAPICHHSYGGWFFGITQGFAHKNIELRLAQYAASQAQDKSLELARRFVGGKIRNCRTMLRRNSPQDSATPALRELTRLASKAGAAASLDTLLGIEGAAARCYFAGFAKMLKPKGEALASFDFASRNRRPPRDPVNALLSFVYSLLAKDLAAIALSVGYDPYLGFYHQPRYGRPALALDLMEEFRPIVADSVVLGLINNGEVSPADFVEGRQACALTTKGRSSVIQAYERRLDTLVEHPAFGYTVSYKRVLEVQARLLGRRLLGEIAEYRPFVTR
jgi:CRISPR-associated protein Cas1